MCRRASIVLPIVGIGAALLIRLVVLHPRASRAEAPPRPTSRDIAATLRQMTSTSPDSVKPWVLDETGFRNAHADRQWIVGRCARPAVSEAEALDFARADAAARLEPIVRTRVKDWPGDRRWVDARIADALRGGRWDNDACVERFDRPYGTVYAGSVLIDASAGRIAPLVRDVRAGVSARHRRTAFHIVLAVLLLIFTWLTYVVSNWLTRGYATTRLRLIATAVTIGVLLVV